MKLKELVEQFETNIEISLGGTVARDTVASLIKRLADEAGIRVQVFEEANEPTTPKGIPAHNWDEFLRNLNEQVEKMLAHGYFQFRRDTQGMKKSVGEYIPNYLVTFIDSNNETARFLGWTWYDKQEKRWRAQDAYHHNNALMHAVRAEAARQLLSDYLLRKMQAD